MKKTENDRMTEAFFDAVDCVRRSDFSERFDVVHAYLAAGGDVNARNADDATALFDAAMNGSAEMVELLLKSGAQVNVRNCWGATPLMYAAMGVNLPAIRLLVQAGAYVNVLSADSPETPMDCAYTEAYLLHFNEVNEEAVACMEYLLQHGARRRVVLDCEDMPDLSPLNYRFLRAVVQEDVKAVYDALADGADVNVRGRYNVSAIEQAARYDNAPLIRALLAWEPDAAAVQAAVEQAECFECSRAMAELA